MFDFKWEWGRNWLLPILWTLQIFYFSLLPRGSFPKIYQQHFDTGYLQYLYHFGQFFCLSLLLYRAVLYSSSSGNKLAGRRNPGCMTLTVVVVVALLDEAIQIPVPTRRFTLRDLAADIVGGAVGLLLMQMTRREGGNDRPDRSTLSARTE